MYLFFWLMQFLCKFKWSRPNSFYASETGPGADKARCFSHLSC